jgi:hypothetical protein
MVATGSGKFKADGLTVPGPAAIITRLLAPLALLIVPERGSWPNQLAPPRGRSR